MASSSLGPRPHPLREKGSGDIRRIFLVVLIQQRCDLHCVRICIDILRERTEPRFCLCLCSVSTLSTVNGQMSRISRSDQGRSDNGVYACAYAYYNKSVQYTWKSHDC